MSLLKYKTLTDWLYYLEHTNQAEIQMGLDRVGLVAKRLGVTHSKARVITVAGTNGKGSTVAALEMIYKCAGYLVGSYTSPHLFLFNERICVNQKPITDDALCSAFQAIEDARGDVCLTYFEMATLAALWYFKQLPLDVIILEVGMGGRLDATNVVDSDLAIITTIGLDHQEFLGKDIESIGYEKAGIMRAGKPCIYADYFLPSSILTYARTLNTPLHCLNVDYYYQVKETYFWVTFQNQELSFEIPRIHFNAAAAAVYATYCLQSQLRVTKEHIAQAMKMVQIKGRKQWCAGKPSTLYDVAHNPQAASSLAIYLKQYRPNARVFAVFSALKDKDLCGLIKPMLSCVDAWYPAILNTKRAANEALLREAFLKEGVSVYKFFNDPMGAYQCALNDANPEDLIVVYGSFFIVSAIMPNKENEYEVCH